MTDSSNESTSSISNSTGQIAPMTRRRNSILSIMPIPKSLKNQLIYHEQNSPRRSPSRSPRRSPPSSKPSSPKRSPPVKKKLKRMISSNPLKISHPTSFQHNVHVSTNSLIWSFFNQQNPETLFSVLDNIGEGSFGSVYKAMHIDSKHYFAIKLIPTSQDFDTAVLNDEVSILQGLSHKNVISYYGACRSPDKQYLWIIMSYCSFGSIKSYLDSKRTISPYLFAETATFERVIASITKSILKGLAYLHSMKICHRDIKCANILLDAEGVVKVSDFGISSYFKSKGRKDQIVGSPWWMSPEVIQMKVSKSQMSKVDIWALGITVMEMIKGVPPFHDMGPEEVMRHIASPNVNPLDEFQKDPDLSDWSLDLFDFLSKCLDRDPKKRWSAKRLLRHPFVRDVKTSNLKQWLLNWGSESEDSNRSEESLEQESPPEEDESMDSDHKAVSKEVEKLFDEYGGFDRRRKGFEQLEGIEQFNNNRRMIKRKGSSRRGSKWNNNIESKQKKAEEQQLQQQLRQQQKENEEKEENDIAEEYDTVVVKNRFENEIEEKRNDDARRRRKVSSPKAKARHKKAISMVVKDSCEMIPTTPITPYYPSSSLSTTSTSTSTSSPSSSPVTVTSTTSIATTTSSTSSTLVNRDQYASSTGMLLWICILIFLLVMYPQVAFNKTLRGWLLDM